MIRARELAVGYGRTPVLEGLDFEVERGEVFLILGGSGCGKTTLLRNLIGLARPLGGRIEIEGHDATSHEEGIPPSFGVLFQSGALFGSMTLAQNVALPLQRWTNLEPETIDLIVRRKLMLVGLDGFENHLPAELSGGMRKRAGIARALALDPALLFLDEPSAGLDPVTAAELDHLILTLKASLGVTFVIVTHELASVFAVGDRCILLDKSVRGIVATGAPRKLAEESEEVIVRRFFRRETGGNE